MKLWVLFYQPYFAGDKFLGVFSSQEKAEQTAAARGKSYGEHPDRYYIRPVMVDEEPA